MVTPVIGGINKVVINSRYNLLLTCVLLDKIFNIGHHFEVISGPVSSPPILVGFVLVDL
jgi:hypothetical protein